MKNLSKILSAQQIRAADQYAIAHEPISSIDLMERASKAFVHAIEAYLSPNQRIAVVCGTGNNGGDGLAIARILMWKGYDVAPFLFMVSSNLSADCLINSGKIDNLLTFDNKADLPIFSGFDVIIDGLFGSGLNREIDGWSGEIVDLINESEAKVISIDIPSGMFCDVIPAGNHIVKSELVISFQRPKLSFFFVESAEYVQDWKAVDIGLDEDYIQNQISSFFVLDNFIVKYLNKRQKYSHKGNYGHALLIAGARGKMGAAVLSGGGCLRSGVGLLTMHVPSCGLDIVQISIPEAMCSIDLHSFHFTTLPSLAKFNCIGIGPGIGTSLETKEALVQLMNMSELPLVLDADALNIISLDPTLQDFIPKDAILTPHPKEFERMAGTWRNSQERLEKQVAFSTHHQCIVVLKDAVTIISDSKGRVFFNTTGNPGMASGGSGDVLTGIITGLLGQKYSPCEAALIGVYYHGLAGDSASSQKGENALLASDIVNNLRIE